MYFLLEIALLVKNHATVKEEMVCILLTQQALMPLEGWDR
jgi:hypothetical protein